MRLKASVDYGLRIVLYLAETDRTVSSAELEEKMAVPRDYVIQLATKLRNKGIIKGVPGRNGGYRLGRDPNDITALEVTETFDDHQHAKHDIRKKRDPDAIENHILNMHTGVVASFCSFLDAITVADLIAVKDKPEASELIAIAALEKEANRLKEQAAKKAARKNARG